jgi:hypothetical protein
LAEKGRRNGILEWGGIAAPLTARVMTREAAVSVAFAVIAFAAYWFLGPQETAYSYQVSQANNIIHGHLDLRPEYSRNLSVLERVLYDGDRFCLPPGDEDKLPGIVEYEAALKRGESPDQARQSVISPSCKTYMQHSVGAALLVLPAVLVWGGDLNQALVSAVIGALTAVVVYAVARRLTENLLAQVSLTALMMFGTIFWWVAANGGVWFFAHTTAVFFMFSAIYFTLVRRSPVFAGALLGAAFMCRPTVLMAGLFFVVMFSDLWLRPRAEGRSVLGRIDWRPVAQFAAGIAPFIVATMLVNYVRYDSPFETGYNYVESAHQTFLAPLYARGTLDVTYIERHPPVILGVMPVFQRAAPYILPSWFGMAIWVTTPAFFYALFLGQRRKWIIGALAASLAAAALAIAVGAASRGWDLGPFGKDITGSWDVLPFWNAHVLGLDLMGSWQYLPFYAGVALSIAASTRLLRRERDPLAIACWAAIVPTVLVIFSFAFIGWAQFGYRYGLDFYPFLWLLVARAIGSEMKWHHWALIGMSIAVNVWGVLWIYQFERVAAFGVAKWVTF